MMAPPLVVVVVLLLLSMAVVASAAAYGGDSAPSPDLHHIELLSPILLSLGYQEIAMAVNSVLPSPINSNWSAPVTLFAPSDDSVRSCPPPSCSPLLLLRQHLVPGLLTAADLTRLPFGSKLETADASRCLAVTSTASGSKMFVDGVEITRPDLFVGGQIAIHGLQGFVAPLSPLSCSPPVPNPSDTSPIGPIPPLMLRDAIVRLHHGGYSILALGLHLMNAELAELQKMTIFALDDQSIFDGGSKFVSSVRFHIVPDIVLVHADLLRLHVGDVLPTLLHGQRLSVTHSGSAAVAEMPAMGVRINYVPIRAADVIYNARIAVHGIFMPFPHLFPADLEGPVVPEGNKCTGSTGGASTAWMTEDLVDDGL